MFDFIKPSFWFKKRESALGGETVRSEQLARFNALYGCDPDKIASAVTSFACGYLGPIARIIEEFERRDDKMMVGSMKMKASVGRCDYQIRIKEGFENDPRAKIHADTLKKFWSTIRTTDRFKQNERGGFRLLRKQMMEAQSYGFAVHEIVWTPVADGSIRAEFIRMPLWHFENKTGALRFLRNANASDGVEMVSGEWLVTTGDGVGIAASIVAMAKRLSFQDWLLFSERSGMPIIIGKTGATFGSDQWNRLRGLISAIYRDTRALVDSGTTIEAIQTGSTANLPFPALIEWADRAIASLYRGADLSTISKGEGTGASLQGEESGMLEQDACENLSEALHEQVDKFVIRYATGDEEPLAYVSIESTVKQDVDTDIKIDQHLGEFGVRLSKKDMLARYGRTEAKDDDDAAERKMSGQELPSEPATSGLSLDQLASLIYPLKAAGYTIEKRQLEQATKLKLEETADPNAQPAEPGLANEGQPRPTDEGQKSDKKVLAAFAQDTGPAADAIAEFLKAPGKDAAEALMKRLPDLIPEDPAMAAVIAEAMAKEFGKFGLENEQEDADAWEIVDISVRAELANEGGSCTSPNGVEGCKSVTCPGKNATIDEQDADTGKRLVGISKDPNASPIMIPPPEGLETQLRVDPKAAAHFVDRRNQQRNKRIERAKASGDAEALAKAEAMMTGEHLAEILPSESRKGKVTGRYFDEKQGKDIVDIDTPLLHIAAQKKRPSRKHRQGDKEFGVSTAFPPDIEFSAKKKRGAS